MEEREKNLPRWAQELIADLRKRVSAAVDPLTREIARLRPERDTLKARNEALIELLECAARGGHKTAQDIVNVLAGYSLTLTKDEN